MSGRNFSLTPRLSAFVDEQVASGRHQNASEVVREALRRYEDDMAFTAAQIEEIKAIAARGRADFERGDYITINTPDEAQALRQRLRAEARARVRQHMVDAEAEAESKAAAVKF
ncbi:type II toxin-antitoxin system ParD family antitoxin [Telmatospirillum sp.]|uniref:type II toxin-antitoxin system ParD family antitoxin n=1 Tax=Telmatospirillum sp. TaxID=2079197 RepID=UPI00284AF4AC|nr:type II toxin-antitoxin system ParD family antitoxin [Telmatospirillum sp.]MDR3435545.1 type II toxin-antitoxin system ParD family antitoxin [Telmatospirillum sp.]